MKTKFLVLAGILVCSASLQAATSYLLDFGTQASNPTLQYDGAYAISPYTGTVNNTSVQLYCVDFNDTTSWGTNDISVYSTQLLATQSVLQAQTRYGKNNAPGNSYTAGTTLYEEMAWLATQMMNVSGTYATQNRLAIQEAIWTLSDSSTGATAPHNAISANGYTGTASSGLSATTGGAQSYTQWISNAMNYVTAFNGGASWGNSGSYTALVASNWYVITAVNAAGCTVGTTGSTGCTPGSAGSGSSNQEFLAYKAGGGLVVSTPNVAGVPEPATFVMIGSGLLAGALVRRRRKA